MMDWLKTLSIEELPDPYRSIAELIGIDKAIKIADIFGGEHVYFKKIDSIIATKKKQYIVENFRGDNYAALAKATGYSVSYVYTVLKSTR